MWSLNSITRTHGDLSLSDQKYAYPYQSLCTKVNEVSVITPSYVHNFAGLVIVLVFDTPKRINFEKRAKTKP